MNYLKHFLTLLVVLAALALCAVFIFVPRQMTPESPILTCPDCRHGNFEAEMLENASFHQLSSAWAWQAEETCAEKIYMRPCVGSCLTVLYMKVSPDNPRYIYDSMVHTCSEFVRVQNDWPTYKGRPPKVFMKETSFTVLRDGYNISYVYHRKQYHNMAIFDHLLQFGYPDWPVPALTRNQIVYRSIGGIFIVALIILGCSTKYRTKLVSFCNCKKARMDWSEKRRERREAEGIDMTEHGIDEQDLKFIELRKELLKETSAIEKIYNWLTSETYREAWSDMKKARKSEKKITKLTKNLEKTKEKLTAGKTRANTVMTNEIDNTPSAVTHPHSASSDAPPPPHPNDCELCMETSD